MCITHKLCIVLPDIPSTKTSSILRALIPNIWLTIAKARRVHVVVSQIDEGKRGHR